MGWQYIFVCPVHLHEKPFFSNQTITTNRASAWLVTSYSSALLCTAIGLVPKDLADSGKYVYFLAQSVHRRFALFIA
jgi:hypothetical protein